MSHTLEQKKSQIANPFLSATMVDGRARSPRSGRNRSFDVPQRAPRIIPVSDGVPPGGARVEEEEETAVIRMGPVS